MEYQVYITLSPANHGWDVNVFATRAEAEHYRTSWMIEHDVDNFRDFIIIEQMLTFPPRERLMKD